MTIAAEFPLIVAHRGASADAPENTLAAFREAWRQGADAIEGDFRLSKDGKIVCIHDADTKRVAGVKKSVADTNSDVLRALDVGAWKGEKWRGEKIPLLGEILATIPRGKGIFIEVKCGPEIVPPLLQVLADSDVARAQVTVIAFDKEVVRAVKKRAPELKANYLVSFKKRGSRRVYRPTLKTVLRDLRATGADGLGGRALVDLPEGFGKKIRAAGFGYHLWTVDKAKAARHFMADGAQSLTTNKPGKLRAALEE